MPSTPLRMKYGRFLSAADSFRRARWCHRRAEVQKGLFPESDPTGKWIEVAGRQLEVIGVMRPPAARSRPEDRRVLLPYYTG